MKKLNKNRKKLFKNKRMVVGAITALVALFIVGQLAFDIYVYRYPLQNSDSTTISSLIISAVNNLNKPVPVEASTGKLYFPEARLVLPPADSFWQVKYADISDGGTPELNVTTKAIVDLASSKLLRAQTATTDVKKQVDGVFAEVPSLQACTRGVQIYFSPIPIQNTDDKLQPELKATKQLANGKKLYYYTEPACKEDLSELLTYLKQAQSY